MNAQQVITQVRDNASEWLEMTEKPDEMLNEILAIRILKLQEHIEYLQKRISYYERCR